MANPFSGGGNIPADERYYLRYDVHHGSLAPGYIRPAPPVAFPITVPADRLATSPTAKHADDQVEKRRLYAPELAAGLNAALTGRATNADQTVITSTKLAVEGYVNPWDLAEQAGHRPDVPLVSAKLKLVP